MGVSATVVRDDVAKDVGAVDRAVGWRQVIRETEREIKVELEPDKGFDVISNDDLRTGDGRMQVRFVDDSKLRMTEHTRIVIDNVVFDKDPSKSDLAMTFAQGTARFISGGLGKVDKENIRLKTPTATIGIRGTDFTVTVDEFGKSLIVLLPDINGVSSGEIIVSTMAGEVVLNKPFESTTTTLFESPPSNPAILDLSLDMLNNIMIINPPKEEQTYADFMDTLNEKKNINPLDIDFLDEALLDEDELDRDYLEFTELDVDFLNVDFLQDLLDDYSDILDDKGFLSDEQKGGDLRIEGTEEGFDTTTQFNTIVDAKEVRLLRNVNDIVDISTDVEQSTFIDYESDGIEFDPIKINGGQSTTITIKQ